MNKELAMQWVKALRSGKYNQGRWQLRSNQNQYCCLGVLCDISNKSDWVKPGHSWEYLGQDVELNFELREELGLSGRAMTSLIEMNDEDTRSFNDIADYIEANYENL